MPDWTKTEFIKWLCFFLTEFCEIYNTASYLTLSHLIYTIGRLSETAKKKFSHLKCTDSSSFNQLNSCQGECRSFRLQVVSPTGWFAYTSKVDSPTQIKINIFRRIFWVKLECRFWKSPVSHKANYPYTCFCLALTLHYITYINKSFDKFSSHWWLIKLRLYLCRRIRL